MDGVLGGYLLQFWLYSGLNQLKIKMNKKTPTQKEKIEMYEKFLHKINMCVMCCDDLGVQELVHNADMWSYMHRCGNGEPSEREQQRMINSRFWKLLDTPKSDAAVEERQRKYSERQNEISNQGS